MMVIVSLQKTAIALVLVLGAKKRVVMTCSSAAAFRKYVCPQFRCHIYSDSKFQPCPWRIRGIAMSNTGY